MCVCVWGGGWVENWKEGRRGMREGGRDMQEGGGNGTGGMGGGTGTRGLSIIVTST